MKYLPFFAIGFALAAVSQLTLIALGTIGVSLALIYLTLSKKGGNGGGGAATSNDQLATFSKTIKKGVTLSTENYNYLNQIVKRVWWRSTFLQGSWNYERMQNLGWAYSLIPAIKNSTRRKTKRLS